VTAKAGGSVPATGIGHLPVHASKTRKLSAREQEVALLVAQGLRNRDIAARLGLSIRTAESHVERIRRKLSFRCRAEIAAWITKRRR
jgi:DNA-binding NarL/FixJ family response regulator